MKRIVPSRGWLVVLLALSWCSRGLAATITGRKAGGLYVEFAKLLAREDTEMTLDLARWLGSTVDADCKVEKEEARSFSRVQKRLAGAFAAKVCKPYLQLWEEAAAPCDKKAPPEWREDENGAAERVDLDGYFGALTDGIREAPSEIERDALMFGLVGALSTHVTMEFPNERVVQWATQAMLAYTQDAPPDKVLRSAHMMVQAWVPPAPELAKVLTDYARDHKPLTGEQVEQINSVAHDLEAR